MKNIWFVYDQLPIDGEYDASMPLFVIIQAKSRIEAATIAEIQTVVTFEIDECVCCDSRWSLFPTECQTMGDVKHHVFQTFDMYMCRFSPTNTTVAIVPLDSKQVVIKVEDFFTKWQNFGCIESVPMLY